MIALRRQKGQSLALRLTVPFDMTGVQVVSAIRDEVGNVWHFAVQIDTVARTVTLDAGVDARILPPGQLWFDVRFTRDELVVHQTTVLVVLLDDLAEDAARVAARADLARRALVEGRVYLTIEGDVLDAICARELGSDALAPSVLDAHPGLAALGPIYPAGLALLLPSTPAPQSAAARITLWGRA